MKVTRLTPDARKRVLALATEEAARRGDRRIGADHLLLGLLHEPSSVAARALGVDLESARAASEALDRAALAAVGIDATLHGPGSPPIRAHRRPPFTSGARAALQRSLHEARSMKARSIDPRHLLLGILSRQRPDPAAELLAELGVDPADVRRRLIQQAS